MKHLGILLPKSSTHPDIGYDFFFGLKGYFFSLGQNPNIHTANIGFGIDEDLLFSEAERMFLEKNVDLIVVFAEHPKVDKIFPLASQFKRPILVVNPGAKYPVDWKAPEFVFFLSLEEMLSAKLAAKFALAESGINQVINATNFYDGGYGIGDAFYLGQEAKNGRVTYNFVGKHKVSDFDAQPLTDYLGSVSEPNLVFSIFTGPILPYFLELIGQYFGPNILVCSQVMIHEMLSKKLISPLTFSKILSCSSIDPINENKDLGILKNYLENEVKRQYSIFSSLGWDAGLVIMKLLDDPELTWSFRNQFNESISLVGSRGEIFFHSESGHFLPQIYQIKILNGELETFPMVISEVIKEWEELIEKRSIPPQVGWFNTYLCS